MRRLATCLLLLGIAAAHRAGAEEPSRVEGKTVAEWIQVFRTDKHVDARQRAAAALGEFGPAAAAAVPVLAAPFHQGDATVGLHAASAIARIGGAGLDVLVECLHHGEHWVQLAGVHGLRRASAPPERVIAALVQVVQADRGGVTDVAIGEPAAVTLGELKAIDALMRLSADASATIRRRAVLGLGHCKDHPPEALALLRRAAKDPDESVRAVVIQAMCYFGEVTIPDRLEAVEDPCSVVRELAIESLDSSATQTERAFSVLCKALSDVDGRVRRRATQSIAAYYEVEVGLPALASVLWDADAGPLAARALARSGQGAEVLLSATKSTDLRTRVNAARGLGEVHTDPDKVCSALIKSIGAPEGELRSAAAGALARQGRHAVPHVVPLLRHADANTRALAAWVLAIMGEKALASLGELIVAVGDPDAHVRKYACYALQRMGPNAHSAIPALTKALADPDGSVRADAIRALDRLGADGAELTSALERLVSDEDKTVREAAQDLLDGLKAR